MKRIEFVVSISDDVSHAIFHGLLQRGNGISYVTELNSSVKNQSNNPLRFRVLKAAMALNEVKVGSLDSAHILVVQHGMDKISQQLIGKGAIPFMLLMFESPLYAGRFYDHLSGLERKFLYSQVFLPIACENDRRFSVRFPSFSLQNLPIKADLNWQNRSFSSMVVANKYVALQSFSDSEGVESFFWILINKLKNILRGSPAPKSFDLREFQLQDRRLDAIIYFKGIRKLDLYGRGWKSIWRIPPRYRKLLAPILKGGIADVDDKAACIHRYKFNFCFENVRYPGYVTEKIFDAMVANTVPVYLGAPDIADFVPPETFIDASKFSTFEELFNYMSNINLESAMVMLDAAQAFLRSKRGIEFSNEGFISSISEKIEAYINA